MTKNKFKRSRYQERTSLSKILNMSDIPTLDNTPQHNLSLVSCSRSACCVCLFVRERKNTKQRDNEK